MTATHANYLLADAPVASDRPLPLLRRCLRRDRRPALIVRVSRRMTRPPTIRRWHHRWLDAAGRTLIGVARLDSGYLLRFPGLCDFRISSDAREVEVRPQRTLEPEVLEHLIADQVLPRCLAQQGELMVHAAGVAFGREIALFVGESGFGKSTLSGLFLRSRRTVLSDDCLLLRPARGAVRAVPTYPSLRLRPDSAAALFAGGRTTPATSSYPGKQRFALPDATRAVSSGRLCAVYFLGDGRGRPNDVRIAPLAPAAACTRLMEQVLVLDALDRATVQRLLRRAGDVLTTVPAFELDYPRDYARSNGLAQAVEQHLALVARRSSAA